MTPETAREILADALSTDTWETPIPEDDAEAIRDAESLVKMAEDAWEQNIRGPEVEAILRIAAADEDGEKPAPKAKPAKPAAKKAAPAKPAAKAKPGRPAPKKAAPEPAADAPEEPWEDYDKNVVKDIVEGVEVWAEDLDENLAYLINLYLYEQQNKNRKNIIAACEAAIPADSIPGAAAEPEDESAADEEPEMQGTEVPAEWAEEPFDTYDTLKVADIKEALDEFFENEEYTEEDKLNTLGHVVHYEGENKARSGLIDYLEGVQAAYEEATAGEQPEGEETQAGEAEGAAAPEADTGAASRPSRRASGGTKAGAAAGAGAASDGTTYTVTATIGKSTIEYKLGGKHAVAGTVLDLIETGVKSIVIDG